MTFTIFLFNIQVSYELFKAAEKKGRTDKERFNQLAMSVEKYTSSLLDPLRGNQEEREEFGDALDEILDEALQFRQKKVTLKQTEKIYKEPQILKLEVTGIRLSFERIRRIIGRKRFEKQGREPLYLWIRRNIKKEADHRPFPEREGDRGQMQL